MTYIAIEPEESATQMAGDPEIYLTDTDDEIAVAKQALRDADLESAPIYAGEPDGLGESCKNGQVLLAD